MHQLPRERNRILRGVCVLALLAIPPSEIAAAQVMPLSVAKPAAKDASGKACACKSEGPVVFVYLDGSVKGTDKKSSETSTTSGALAVSIADTKWDATVMINVAASSDSITSGYGQSLLVPGNGGFASGIIDVRRSLATYNLPNVYLRGYLSSSSHRWGIKDDSGKAESAIANTLGSGVGLSWQLFSGTLKRTIAGTDSKPEKEESPRGDSEKEADTESGQAQPTALAATPNKEPETKTEDVLVSARLDFSAIRRALHGQVTETRFNNFRNTLLNNGDNVFHGFEIGILLQYGNIRGSLAYYSFPNATDVDGLTRGQIAAGFAIAAPILSGQLKR